MSHKIIRSLIVLVLWLVPVLLPPPVAMAQGPDWSSISPDLDGDGLSDQVESNWCNALGCFQTLPLDSDSDDDGLTDGKEKLYDTNPLDAHSPGAYVEYEDHLKTRQYFSNYSYSTPKWGWQPYGNQLISFKAVVVRRGATFSVGGPAGATIQVNKSLSSLTTLTPVRDVCAGRWLITVPSDGTVGKYEITLQEGGWSKSLNLYVIFELPTPTSSFTQAMIDAFLYDDDRGNKRDETGVVLGDFKYTSADYPDQIPSQIPSGAWINAGAGYRFNLQQFEPFVFERHVIEAINGRTSQSDAARDLVQHSDEVTRFNNPRTLTSSWSTLYPPGGDDSNQCSNIAGLLAAFNRAAGIPARPFYVDWRHNSFDHATEIWYSNAWHPARGYKVLEDPCVTVVSGVWVWDCEFGHYMPTSRSSWGTNRYKPWHSGGSGIGSAIFAVDENWVWSKTGWSEDPVVQDYRWPSWDWDGVVRYDWFDTMFVPYWSSYGWSQEPQITGTPPGAWPGITDFSITALPASQPVAQGEPISYTVNLNTSDGFSNGVDLSVSGLPANTTAGFGPDDYCVPDCSRTLAIITTASTPIGTHSLTVRGSSGGLERTTIVNLVVSPPAPDFTVSATPASQTVAQGDPADYTVTLEPLNGFSNSVTFSVTGLPADTSATFDPTACVPECTSTLSVLTTADSPTGTHTLTIQGNGGGLQHQTGVDLVITESGAPGLTLGVASKPTGAMSDESQGELSVQGVTDYGLDLDGDGYYDRLVIELEVNTPQAGTYWIQGQLGVDGYVPSLLGAGGLLATSVVRAELMEGGNKVQLSFDGLRISANKIDGPYLLKYLAITDVDNPGPDEFANDAVGYWDSLYTTASYASTEFENLGALLSGSYSHSDVDSDGNGRSDVLVVETGIDVYQAGSYSVRGNLYDGQDEFVGQATWVGTGPEVTLRFEELAGTVGPYKLRELELFNAQGGSIDYVEDAYTVRGVTALSSPDIISLEVYPAGDRLTAQGETITPTNVFAASLVDGNLRVQAEVQVSAAGSYKLEAWLTDAAGNLLTWASGQPTNLNVGVRTLSLTFDGRAIRAWGLDGPYHVVALKILGGGLGYEVLDEVDEALTTQAYTVDQFASPVGASGLVLFNDNMENGSSQWTAGSRWTLNNSVWFSYSNAWKASTSGSQSSSLTTIPLDLSSYADPTLRFRTCYNIPSPGDVGHLQVSTNNGDDWIEVADYTDSTPHWSTQILDLSQFDGTSQLQLRFNADSESGLLWYVDDVYVVSSAPDSDGDGLSNTDESAAGTDPNDPDTDDDGLSDGQEVDSYQTDPNDADSDNDGMPDGWEVDNGLDPGDGTGDDGANADADGDGLNNLDEYTHGTDPNDADSDNDGLSDGDEVTIYHTDPADSDSDDDGLTDSAEVNTHNTDPNDADSDNDGLDDGEEINTYSTDPNDADSDNDGMPDGWEVDNALAPLDDDDNGSTGPNDDPDEDDLSNLEEYLAHSDPHDPDTDGDGIPDGIDPTPAGGTTFLPIIFR